MQLFIDYLRKGSLAAFTVVLAIAMLGANGDQSRFQELGHHRLICPCGCTQLLLECNHVGCQYSDKMIAQLAERVQKDSSDDSVLQSFVQEYGNTVLAAPTHQGFDRVAWIMPFAVFFVGSFTAAAVIRNWKARSPAMLDSHPVSPDLDPYREQARKETEL
jgi:cytochrome c-type biogenesis protein CcmH/NrfF